MKQLLLRLVKRLFNATVGPVLDSRIRRWLLYTHTVFGPPGRLSISPTAIVNNAHFNTSSGSITVGDHVFFSVNVCVITGHHDIRLTRAARQRTADSHGHDIHIRPGAWIAVNATLIGPCVIGEDSVVAAGSVVIHDVPPRTLVAGIPARVIRHLDLPPVPPEPDSHNP